MSFNYRLSVTKENRNKVPSCVVKASLGKKHLRWDLNGEKNQSCDALEEELIRQRNECKDNYSLVIF